MGAELASLLGLPQHPAWGFALSELCTCLWGDEMSGGLAVSDTEQVVNKYCRMNE